MMHGTMNVKLQYSSTLSHKRHDLKTKVIETVMWFLFSLQLCPKYFVILRRT